MRRDEGGGSFTVQSNYFKNILDQSDSTDEILNAYEFFDKVFSNTFDKYRVFNKSILKCHVFFKNTAGYNVPETKLQIP